MILVPLIVMIVWFLILYFIRPVTWLAGNFQIGVQIVTGHRPFKSDDSSHLDPAGVLFGLGEIILHLESKPHLGLAAESFRQANGHFRGNAGLSIYNIV